MSANLIYFNLFDDYPCTFNFINEETEHSIHILKSIYFYPDKSKVSSKYLLICNNESPVFLILDGSRLVDNVNTPD